MSNKLTVNLVDFTCLSTIYISTIIISKLASIDCAWLVLLYITAPWWCIRNTYVHFMHSSTTPTNQATPTDPYFQLKSYFSNYEPLLKYIRSR